MKRFLSCAAGLLLMLGAFRVAEGQEVLDRIAARVENDVILLSDVRALARYQLFLDGKSESDKQILDRLIDQWIVRNEASVARFPQPKDEEVDRSIQRLQRSFSSPEEFKERKMQSGLSDAELTSMQRSVLFQSNYLDSRFRPAIQINDQEIEDFYKTRVVPRAESRGQTAPSLEAARDFIQEALVQRAITEQAERWLKESRARVHVEILMNENKP
jgi:parvulin-like peptidyl-prolyl isomerase